MIDTSDFALPSEENVGESHKEFANTKRATQYNKTNYGIRVFDMNYYKETKKLEYQQKNAGTGGDTRKRGASTNARGREASNNRNLGGGNEDAEGQKKL